LQKQLDGFLHLLQAPGKHLLADDGGIASSIDAKKARTMVFCHLE